MITIPELELKKHILDFDKAFHYFKNRIDDVNILSSKLIELNNFSDGCFFTLLPEDADISVIYDFEGYGILPQNPEIEYYVDGKKATYSAIPTRREELADLLLRIMQSQDNIYCIFDDVNRLTTDELHMEFFHAHGLFYEKEVYYWIGKPKTSNKLIKECLDESHTFWHCLCVLTKANLNNIKNKKLDLENIDEICLKSELIFVGAYDGEGYVFWERGSDKQISNQGLTV